MGPTEVRFVTSNPGKYREVRALLRPYEVRVRWSRRPLPEPQADRLHDVVTAKLAAVPKGPEFVLVEDSGLFIDSLNGFPGVYSAYIYRIWKFDPILELLRHRPRAATFRTVAGLRRGRSTWQFEGECPGSIARRPRGSEGFGFDSIFIPQGDRKTYAEASPAEKNARSHRARAMAKVGRFLEGLSGRSTG